MTLVNGLTGSRVRQRSDVGGVGARDPLAEPSVAAPVCAFGKAAHHSGRSRWAAWVMALPDAPPRQCPCFGFGLRLIALLNYPKRD